MKKEKLKKFKDEVERSLFRAGPDFKRSESIRRQRFFIRGIKGAKR